MASCSLISAAAATCSSGDKGAAAAAVLGLLSICAAPARRPQISGGYSWWKGFFHCAVLRCGALLAHDLASPLSSAAERASERAGPGRAGPLSAVSASCLSVEMKKPHTAEMAQCVSASDSETGRCGRRGSGWGCGEGQRDFSEACGQQRSRAGFQNTTSHAPKQRFVLFSIVYYIYTVYTFFKSLSLFFTKTSGAKKFWSRQSY